jgi:hypothetical protein
VLTSCKPRHRHQEFLSFLRAIDKAVPAGYGSLRRAAGHARRMWLGALRCATDDAEDEPPFALTSDHDV